jgi:hypothetical protein
LNDDQLPDMTTARPIGKYKTHFLTRKIIYYEHRRRNYVDYDSLSKVKDFHKNVSLRMTLLMIKSTGCCCFCLFNIVIDKADDTGVNIDIQAGTNDCERE